MAVCKPEYGWLRELARRHGAVRAIENVALADEGKMRDVERGDLARCPVQLTHEQVLELVGVPLDRPAPAGPFEELLAARRERHGTMPMIEVRGLFGGLRNVDIALMKEERIALVFEGGVLIAGEL